jgi:hypothetical protein
MSNYARALARLEKERTGRHQEKEQPRRPPAPALATPSREGSEDPRSVSALAGLFDHLRALARDNLAPTVVFAGASGRTSIRGLTNGLVDEGRRRGREVLIGGPEQARENEGWIAQARAAHDLVLLEAQSLAHSVEAALLARECDGLVIVVEPGTTTREALSTAVERAETADCPILGLVMTESRRWLPERLHRLFATKPR